MDIYNQKLQFELEHRRLPQWHREARLVSVFNSQLLAAMAEGLRARGIRLTGDPQALP